MNRLIKKENTTLKIVYAGENFPTSVTKSIFLAGPTPRNNNVESWRNNALEVLEQLKYDGHVFIPEPKSGEKYPEYDNQINWELQAMKRADIILFWIPRELKEMPGFTTNVEFGSWIETGKVVVGFPKDTDKIRYLEELANKNSVKCHSTLEDTIKDAINKVREGSLRTNGECEVPLFIWNTKSFQSWYNAQKSAGNTLNHADLKFTHRVGPNKDIVFLWALHVDVFIQSENRNKTNEIVISRTGTSYTVIYKKGKDIFDTELVLVKEFRSPASTKDGFIWELVGGSSFDDKDDELEVASSEIYEETGFEISKDRIKRVQERQLNGTLTAHKTSLFSVEITEEELSWFKGQKGKVNGKEEDSERTYIEVLSVQEILSNELLDWSNIGMLMKVLMDEKTV